MPRQRSDRAPVFYSTWRRRPAIYLARSALGGRDVEGQMALASPYGELERLLGGDVGQRLARGVPADHGRLVDLQDDVAGLEPGALGRAAANHERHRRRAGARAAPGDLGRLGVAQDEAELRGHA